MEVNDPNRTSFELQLNSQTVIWLTRTSLANAQRTVNGRLTDARLEERILTVAAAGAGERPLRPLEDGRSGRVEKLPVDSMHK